MLLRTFSTVLFAFVVLSVQVTFPHESEHHSVSADILEELQALREDMDSFVVPRNVSGYWRFVDCERQFLVEHMGVLRIKQRGNYLLVESNDGTFFSGEIRGDHMRFTSVWGPNIDFAVIISTGSFSHLGEISLTVHANSFSFDDFGDTFDGFDDAIDNLNEDNIDDFLNDIIGDTGDINDDIVECTGRLVQTITTCFITPDGCDTDAQ